MAKSTVLKVLMVAMTVLGTSRASLAQVCRSPEAQSADGAPNGIRIPISIHSGLVFVPTTVNGSKLDLLLDSGFEESVIDTGTAQALHLATSNKKLEAAPGGKVETSTVSDVRRSVGGISLEQTSLTTLDLSGLAPLLGHKVEGVLGYDFFKQFVVRLNYQAKSMTLCAPGSFSPGKEHQVAIDLASHQPYIEATITNQAGHKVNASIEIDTGKVDPFSLNAKFAKRSGLLSGSSSLLTVKGVSIGGETQGWVTRAKELTFAGTTLRNPILYVGEEETDRDGGQIGYGILRGFTITFDYSRSRVFFEPAGADETRLQFDHAGLMLAAKGDNYDSLTVFLVIADTPASKAGLQDGDVIESINRRHYTLDSARAFLLQATGPQEFRVLRGQKEISIRVDCEPII